MYEIVFSSSAAGSMKQYAPKTNKVLYLEALMNIGDISEDIPGQKRRQSLLPYFTAYKPATRREILDKMLEQYRDNLAQILQGYKNGESLRLWVSRNSGEQREMYRLMYHLSRTEGAGRVYLAEVSSLTFGPDRAEHIRGLGEMDPKSWQEFENIARKLNEDAIKGYGLLWDGLKHKNGAFRALLNGKLTTVPEDFYDSFIKAEIEEQPRVFNRRQVIVFVITKYNLEIGREVIFSRMERMIEKGLLTALDTPEGERLAYRRSIKRNY